MSEHPGVSLREYIEAIIDERDRRYEQRWQDQQRAIREATATLNSRLDLLNELRGNVMGREEYLAKHDALAVVVDGLRDRINALQGKGAGLNAAWIYLSGATVALAAVITVIVLLLNHG